MNNGLNSADDMAVMATQFRSVSSS